MLDRHYWRSLLWMIVFCIYSSHVLAAERVKILLQGVEGELHTNVLAHLSLVAQKDHPRLNLARIELLNQNAKQEIQAALAPFGYYQPQVEVRVETLKAQPEDQPQWQVTYRIQPGTAVRVATLDLQLEGEGQTDARLQVALKSFPLHVGDHLLAASYESGKSNLLRQASEYGYFKAEFTRKEILLNPDKVAADIHLHLHTGIGYRFGAVKLTQTTFDETFLRRYLNFQPGAPYHNKVLLDLRRDLLNSNYFSDLEIIPERNHSDADNGIPIEIRLTPVPPNRYTASIGYGTDTGLRGGLGWERRYRGHFGHFYQLNAQLSQHSQSFSAQYGIPTGDPRSDSLGFKFGYQNEALDNKNSQLLLTGVNKTQARQLFGRQLRENLSLEYRYETYQLGQQAEVTSKLLVPGISWSYLHADDPVYTRHGYRVGLGVKGAVQDIGSDTSIVQTSLNAAYIFSLGSKNRVLTRTALAMSWMPEFNQVPASMRFFAGGDKSVRGYDYDTLGPRDELGTVIGGQHLFTASLEYTYRLLEKWDLALFYDLGNAFNNEDFSLKQGAGAGVHWLSPIGPIRLDVAVALQDEDGGIRLHINMGPDL